MSETPARRNAVDDIPLSRRRVIVGGGLLLAFGLTDTASGGETSVLIPHDVASGAFTSFGGVIRIAPDESVTFVVPNIEMGQGIYTTEAMMIAEELEISLDKVAVVTALPQEIAVTAPDFLKSLSTGGSRSVRKSWIPLRRAAACARMMLLAAAAKRWSIDPDMLRVQDGVVRDASGRLHASFGTLAADAAQQPLPRSIPLKSPAEWTVIGRSVPRIDIPAKVNGTAVYGIDVRVPGMLNAAIAGPPRWGATIESVRSDVARAIPGVVDVLHTDTYVTVVATRYWIARKGLDALDIHWKDSVTQAVSSDAIDASIRDAAGTSAEVIAYNDPGTDVALEHGRLVRREYDLPFLAHAPMEPLNATVHVRPDHCDVWVGTQVPTRARTAVARITGLHEDNVAIHNHLIGGSFGRRLSTDFIEQAVIFAVRIGSPVKFVWSREEDFRQDLYRPAYHDRIEASLNEDGFPIAWRHHVTGQSVADRFTPGGLPAGHLDADAVAGVVDIPYSVPHRKIGWVRAHTPVPVGWWRGVGPAHNVYVVESFVDELAAIAQIDPIEYRLRLLNHNPRSVGVLKRALQESDWHAPLPRYWGRGVALHNAFGTHCAVITEVSAIRGEAITVRKITAVIDCGVAINRDGLTAQIEGGILFGLSAALRGKISFARGTIEQSNFHNFGTLRINDAPEIATFIVDSSEEPGGIGEVGTTAACPSLGNALFAATGHRYRSYPFRPPLSEKPRL